MRRGAARLLVFAAAAGLLGSCGGSNGGDAQKGDLPVHTVADAGFALGVPEGWQVADTADVAEALTTGDGATPADVQPYLDLLGKPGSPLKFVAFEPDPVFATNVNVIVEPLPEDMTLDQYRDANLRQLESLLEDPPTPEKVDLAAGPAYRLSYDSDRLTGQETSLVQYLLVGEGNGYVLSYTTTHDAIERFRPVFEESARSFRLL